MYIKLGSYELLALFDLQLDPSRLVIDITFALLHLHFLPVDDKRFASVGINNSTICLPLDIFLKPIKDPFSGHANGR